MNKQSWLSRQRKPLQLEVKLTVLQGSEGMDAYSLKQVQMRDSDHTMALASPEPPKEE